MDQVLLALAVLSVFISVIFGVLTWKASQRERERSEARVAALAAAIESEAGEHTAAAVMPGLFSGRRSITFEGHGRIVATVGLLMLCSIGAGVLLTKTGERADTSAAADAATAGVVRAAAAPIELLSMRHTRDGDVLTVAGLVRNPSEGTQVRHVTAVVFGFDRGGGLVTTARGALDFITLQPGAESTFVVALPRGTAVARYRVTFQTERGVLRHVDRRNDPSALQASRL